MGVTVGVIYFVMGFACSPLLRVQLWFGATGDCLNHALPRLRAWRKSEASPVCDHRTSALHCSRHQP